MVSQPGSADAGSRARLVAAAAAEFAARGFDGAKVERIARRARVNKAMLYYHFRNKAALYRAILADLFASLAAVVTRARRPDAPPDEQISEFIAAVTGEIAARPHFPAIWLREMAEGGRHLDDGIARSIAAVVGVLADILREGRARGVFGDAHPLVTQMGIVAPVMLFAVSGPVRDRFRHLVPDSLTDVPAGAVLEHVERATLASLAVSPALRDADRPASTPSRPAASRRAAPTRRPRTTPSSRRHRT